MNVGQRGLMAVINLYQNVRAGRPSPCRYWPTCSEYAKEAVELHGAAKGGWLALRRVSRCHPLGGSGVDPVPASPGGRRDT
jgi:putative membrane protein insertion efficiency factor